MSKFEIYPVPGSVPECPIVLSVDQYLGLRHGQNDQEIDAVGQYLSQDTQTQDPKIWVQYPERMLGPIARVGQTALWDIAQIQWLGGEYGRRVSDASVFLSKYEVNHEPIPPSYRVLAIEDQGVPDRVLQ